MADIFNLTDTWNNGATTFNAIKMNVTDTASNAASLLMDLQVGGVSRFSIAKSTGLAIATSAGVTTFTTDSTTVAFSAGFGLQFQATTAQLKWTDGVGNADVLLVRDAANALALRNSTNAQTLNVYNTYTDASNYERGFISYASNVLNIGHQATGTGNADRSVRLINGGNIRLEVAGGGYIRLPDTSFLEFDERTAPAAGGANTVRIYAVDNGAGKTQLMALFATGAAQQIAIQP